MEVKEFKTAIQEYVYLKQWFAHSFPIDDEWEQKKARLAALSKRNYSEKEIAPFNKELGRARAAVMQHIVREIFSIPQRILIDREVYRRMEGRPTPNFKYLLISPASDEIINSAGALAGKVLSGYYINPETVKSDILKLVRSAQPINLVKEILDGANGGSVPVEHIIKMAYKHYPDLPITE